MIEAGHLLTDWKKIKKSTILEIGDAVLRSACAAQIVG